MSGQVLLENEHARREIRRWNLGPLYCRRSGRFDQASAATGGSYAPESIQKTLENIKLPPGFKIRLYALVPGARSFAVGPQGKVVFVGTVGTAIYAVTTPEPEGCRRHP